MIRPRVLQLPQRLRMERITNLGEGTPCREATLWQDSKYRSRISWARLRYHPSTLRLMTCVSVFPSVQTQRNFPSSLGGLLKPFSTLRRYCLPKYLREFSDLETGHGTALCEGCLQLAERQGRDLRRERKTHASGVHDIAGGAAVAKILLE